MKLYLYDLSEDVETGECDVTPCPEGRFVSVFELMTVCEKQGGTITIGQLREWAANKYRALPEPPVDVL